MLQPFRILGIMSGTSLDGVDLALCEFRSVNGKVQFEITHADTVEYSQPWKERLRGIEGGTAMELAELDAELGSYFGELSREFLKGKGTVDFISSHGHTIFHQPEKGFTLQVGSGAAIAAVSGFPVVCDFRSKDVSLGGHGAPLVPIGDELLFSEYDYCLNLGGIANISFRDHETRKAYDICPVNLVFNELAKEKNQEFDRDGDIAKNGKIIEGLFNELEDLEYYKVAHPKSLGREWLLGEFFPVLHKYNSNSVEDRMATCLMHIATRIAKALESKAGSMLVTGGGAYNSFLLEQIRKRVFVEVIVPEKNLVEYKEALIFAFLGMLRWEGQTNVLSSVTGARADSCSGAIYL